MGKSKEPGRTCIERWIYRGTRLLFPLSPTRDAQAVRPFFGKALNASHTAIPRVITSDTHAASPKALTEMKAASALPASCELRQSNYLTTLVEHDHRFLKWLVTPGMGFFSFETA